MWEEEIRKRCVYDVIDIRLGMRILDVGCGVGNWSLELASMGAEVVGVDFSEEMIKIAKRRIGKHPVNFVLASVEEVELEPESFDTILCITVLQHILSDERLSAAVKNIVRACRQGGIIVVLESCLEKDTSSHLSSYQILRSKRMYIDIFRKNGAQLENEKCVAFFGRISLKLYGRLYNLVYHSQYNDHLKSCSRTQPERARLRGIGPRIRKLILTLSKPFDYHLSSLSRHFDSCDLKLLSFRKT